MTLTLVHLREDAVPKGGERIEWMLITTLPVGTVKQAQEVVDLYALRWRIEEYHRILTSGCNVEKIARTTPERVKRAVTINAVIAWRLATLTLLGRETPEQPAATMLSETEINLLHDDAISHNGVAADRAEHTSLFLDRVVMLIARLGGYLNRKADAPPGHQIVREGYTRLAIGTRTMERFMDNGPKSPFYKQYAQREND